MDYQWYFEQQGGGTGVQTDLETETITVTEGMRSTSWKTDRIDPASLAWQVEAFSVASGVTMPVEVDVSTTVSDNSTAFDVSWRTPFNGFINITTWKKK